MKSKELESYKRILIELKRSIENALDGLNEDVITPSDSTSHYPDDPSLMAGDEFEKAKSYNIINVDQSILELVDNAIDRVENGNYGVCSGCGKEIEKGRLNSKPYAEYCVSCREKLEKEGKV
ncbi:TraR/DksA C4-type zinc finger protein [bacterium]|nr:TraR/DksA C4-type zinc finger protein [bacterium]MCK5598580.1 TraR/DksA C4-type zinc finger protein [bacterium]